MKRLIVSIFLAGIFISVRLLAIEYPSSIKPGIASATASEKIMTLGNEVIALKFKVSGEKLYPVTLLNKHSSSSLSMEGLEFFRLIVNGKELKCSDFSISSGPLINNIEANSLLLKKSAHNEGKSFSAILNSPDGNIQADWSVFLNDSSNYIKQKITFKCLKSAVLVSEYELVEIGSDLLHNSGTVDGSPAVSEDFFFAFEHPMSQNRYINHKVQCFLKRSLALNPCSPVAYSSVYGAVPKGQLRRGFLYYIERERNQPYHQFLHYNSWFDLSWDGVPMLAEDCMKAVQIYCNELVLKRGAKLDGFLWDDGWNDLHSLWQFNNEYFPNGFIDLRDTAAKYKVKLGTWMSPWVDTIRRVR